MKRGRFNIRRQIFVDRLFYIRIYYYVIVIHGIFD